MSPLFTFVLPWSNLDKPSSSDPWFPQVFPQEWTNLMINSLSLLHHTHLLTPQTATKCRNRFSPAACQPITTTDCRPATCHHPATFVPPRLFTPRTFFYYNHHLEESAFITFNYRLYQSSPFNRPQTLCWVTPPPPPTAVWPFPTCSQWLSNFLLLSNPIVSWYVSSPLRSSHPTQVPAEQAFFLVL